MKPWAESFYMSKSWKSTRKAYIDSVIFCERCSTPENPVIATIVHHKTYLTPQNINNPYVTLNWDNLEALCQNCHNKEHHGSGINRDYEFDCDGNIIPCIPPYSENRDGE